MTVRRELRVPGLPEPLSHYTDAVQFGNLLLVSGCTALDEHGNVVAAGDPRAQARQTMTLLGRVLEHAGASFADILKVTVFLTDVSHRAVVNEVREEFFGAARPASTLIEVSALVLPGLVVEMEAVVGLPG